MDNSPSDRRALADLENDFRRIKLWIYPRHRIEHAGRSLDLSFGMGTILAAFFRRRPADIISRDDLIDAVFGHHPDGGPIDADNYISVTIHNAKKRLPRIGLRMVGRVFYTRGYAYDIEPIDD